MFEFGGFDILSLLGLAVPSIIGGVLGNSKKAQPDLGAARAAQDAADTARQALEDQRREREAAAAVASAGAYSDEALRARDRKLRAAQSGGFGDYSPVGAAPPSSVAYKVAFGD